MLLSGTGGLCTVGAPPLAGASGFFIMGTKGPLRPASEFRDDPAPSGHLPQAVAFRRHPARMGPGPPRLQPATCFETALVLFVSAAGSSAACYLYRGEWRAACLCLCSFSFPELSRASPALFLCPGGAGPICHGEEFAAVGIREFRPAVFRSSAFCRDPAASDGILFLCICRSDG